VARKNWSAPKESSRNFRGNRGRVDNKLHRVVTYSSFIFKSAFMQWNVNNNRRVIGCRQKTLCLARFTCDSTAFLFTYHRHNQGGILGEQSLQSNYSKGAPASVNLRHVIRFISPFVSLRNISIALTLWRPLLSYRYICTVFCAYRVKPSFVIFDIWALWRLGLSVRVPRCQKLQMTA